MKKHVLLVDEDVFPMKFYVKALNKHGFNVKHIRNPDQALEFIEAEKNSVEAVILDIMLPPGETYKNIDTNNGLETGVYLLQDLRKQVDRKLPIIILTNVQSPETLTKIQKTKYQVIAAKLEYPPYDLARLLKKLMNKE
ncbi:response regulator [candidate division KSB1 bacterium]|nr:response regulator [candidate division KSB1 bacterium]